MMSKVTKRKKILRHMKKIILLSAAFLSLVGCTAEDNYIEESGIPAQISATIGNGLISRAHDNLWGEGDTIGITMIGQYSNLKYTTDNGDGKFAGTTMYFKNKVDPVTLTAYYPYAGNENESPAVIETSTDASRQTEEQQPLFDFLYAVKENVTGSNPNINFEFSHKMSKLTLVFKNGNGIDVSTIASYEINGLVQEGTFNPLTGACAAKEDSEIVPLNMTPTVQNGVPLPSLILFPQTIKDKVTLRIKDTENQQYACDLNFAENSLKSGNDYIFNITVNRSGLTVGASIVDWLTQKPEKDPNAFSDDD